MISVKTKRMLSQSRRTWTQVLRCCSFSVAIVGLLLLAARAPAASLSDEAKARPIGEFYGQYIGHAVSDAQIVRDLSVTIGPSASRGFFISWTTVSHHQSGNKRKMYQVKFRPSKRTGIYRSAMKTNVFGGQVSLDPLAGEPFVWARVKGDTLTVHTMVITEDGGYEMQIYDRTLNKQGLLLEYSRLRSDEELRHVKTQLIRVAD